ncbi:SRPBCC family protein [Sandarakinorhabdus limnophila]|jgi:uncharacterized protein YndB with AHSA1/START domain|uniref:SRPBCC family protein n=1 Tax=Sandarakinorhabdus limnophila TaxID=210512 RepID=UPI0012ECA632|nr:SRPBCC domain-containing protein [Sandarakinorhabdus limnophila]
MMSSLHHPAIASGLLLATMASPAQAAVIKSAPDGFVSESSAVIGVKPARMWRALTNWSNWWDKAHSYSGKAEAIHLDPRGGGLLLERWDKNSVKHAVVLSAVAPSSLRMSGGFGPLQALPVNAILEFSLRGEGSDTRLTMTYRVAGTAANNLDTLAVPEDNVMSEGFSRLLNYAATGKP